MDVAAVVIRSLQMKRFNECSHIEWQDAPANQNPQIGELQCKGCGVIATEQGRATLKAQVEAQKEREKQNIK